MQETFRAVWQASVDFWSDAYALTEENKKELLEGTDPNGWQELAPSEKQLLAISGLASCRHLLDYGCGSGWASVLAAKAGCPCVTAVDVAKNSRPSAELLSSLYGVRERIRILTIPSDWLFTEAPESYDGLFSSNVLDVVPEEVSDQILSGASRVLRPGSPAVISLNYYTDPQPDTQRNRTVQDGKYLFVDGILRLACYTDEQWITRFEPFFRVEDLVHYAWPNETEERRRLFFLRKP